MKIRVDSIEYRCWHEVGHATVCLYLGGDVDSIELLSGDARGHARARCVVTSEIERSVACGGFAAEFYLLNNGYAERGLDDERDISRIVFHSSTSDREDFWGRKLGSNEVFTETEDREFMHHAIGSHGHGGMVPIFNRTFLGCRISCASFAMRRGSKVAESRKSCGSTSFVEAMSKRCAKDRRARS